MIQATVETDGFEGVLYSDKEGCRYDREKLVQELIDWTENVW